MCFDKTGFAVYSCSSKCCISDDGRSFVFSESLKHLINNCFWGDFKC